MPAEMDRQAVEADVQTLCGKWMPRKQTTCGRRSGHLGDCRSAEALADHRERKTERRRGQTFSTPAARARWRVTHKLKRYGLTEADFDRLLRIQGNACAMCHEPFGDGDAIFIDHDHACCAEEKRSCGACRRGLLCLRCNAALGYIERYTGLARKYLDNRREDGPISVEALATPGVW